MWRRWSIWIVLSGAWLSLASGFFGSFLFYSAGATKLVGEVKKNAIDVNKLTIHRLLAAATVTWQKTFSSAWMDFGASASHDSLSISAGGRGEISG